MTEMREITWTEAIEIATRRRDNMGGLPLYVVFNGLKGDFDSLRNLGIVGKMEEDYYGNWRICAGTGTWYLPTNSTVWVG